MSLDTESSTMSSPQHQQLPRQPTATGECPFCGKRGFKSLGRHLPRCAERDGRDYSMYLSDKTINKKTAIVPKYCPKCHKRFRRLDTHLRVSATCHQFSPLAPPSSDIQPQHPQTEEPDQAAILNFPPAQAAILDSAPSQRPRVKLPVRQEEWEAANIHFSQVLVPEVLAEASLESKNTRLSDGIYHYFASEHGVKQHSKQRRRKDKLAKALNEAKKEKNEARRMLRQARATGNKSAEEIMSLARSFYKMVHSHNRCKRLYQRAVWSRNADHVRGECHQHFWPFARRLLDKSSQSVIEPQFSLEEAVQYFTDTYHAVPESFTHPEWMPSPPSPSTEFNCEGITLDEIAAAVKRSRTRSTPSPLDGVPYVVFKRCPALLTALHDVFNICWAQSQVPAQWKVASVKLLGKPAAMDDPSIPSNFRPIALTSCVGKLFTTILRNRWLSFMQGNKYLNRSVQKAFMPKTPGCIEHHHMLAEVFKDAKKKHKSLAVCWLDLANAYGSVNHSLILYSLRHYHAPPQFLKLIQAFYSDLSATITSSKWHTPPIPLKRGVYQGDPLSVVIFNTVINTMVDTIMTRRDLGYSISENMSVTLMQYADDTCLVARSPAAGQQLLLLVDKWLSWSGMKAKVPKCYSLGLKASAGKLLDPGLSISGQRIPFASEVIKFLGRSFEVPHNISRVKEAISSRLLDMLKSVDTCPLTRGQKLKMYRGGVCPRLTWLLTIEDLPISWVEKNLDSAAVRYVKKWAGLARSANPTLLFLPHKMGGLNLPLISILYKRLQVCRQSQLLTSPDPCVRLTAEKELQQDLTLQRPKFKPRLVVREVMMNDPNFSRKTLSKGAKLLVEEESFEERHQHLVSLEKGGQMFSIASIDAADIWERALVQLSDDQRKFALNAALDTLPHNANLHLWKKRSNSKCTLCGERQSLIHILNNCPAAL